ncbi:hypothetical protein [Flaviflagellibacter deserti]|jgi:hypothetical protein|uniref:Uncharacterized protein n=1 Tax=Flaviflagellibacter deserti TaxID=2267266 RepID=A0ABV9Z155_9HYPH
MTEAELKHHADETDAKAHYRKEKREEKAHEKAVEDTFPASDPPATSQPGHGITKSEKLPDPVKRKA